MQHNAVQIVKTYKSNDISNYCTSIVITYIIFVVRMEAVYSFVDSCFRMFFEQNVIRVVCSGNLKLMCKCHLCAHVKI